MDESYDHIQKYLSATITDDMRLIISDFAIFWNKYEESLFNNSYHSSKIYTNVIERIEEGNNIVNGNFVSGIKMLFTRIAKYYDMRNIELEYNSLRNHYNIRNNDITQIQLEELIKSKTILDKLHFILFIVGRVRNNMFHGIKNISDLPNQKELFLICNETLILILKATNNWPL